MPAYYNEHDPFAAAWLRNLIAAGYIAPGDVDERSIVDVRADDLKAYAQCHFFAGIGGWSYALRLAGWDDERPVWTGSCPCQPFSLAGQQKGFADERHLWPVWRELIAIRRPAIVFGEQVASAAEWLRLVRGDLEQLEYAVGAIPFEAASAGADHLRNRYGLVAHDTRVGRGEGRPQHGLFERGWNAVAGGRSACDDVANNNNNGSQGWSLLPECAGERAVGADGVADAVCTIGEGAKPDGNARGLTRSSDDCGGDVGIADGAGWPPGQSSAARTRHGSPALATSGGDVAEPVCADQRRHAGNTRSETGQGSGEARPADGDAADGPRASSFEWVIGADGKARRVKPGIRLLVDGFPNRVGLLRGFGNAIDPRAFAQFIGAACEAVGDFVMIPLRQGYAGQAAEVETFYYDRTNSPVCIRIDGGLSPEARVIAIRDAIAKLIRKARRYMKNGEGEGTHWTEGFGGRVIEWALSLKPEKILNHRAGEIEATPIGHPAGEDAFGEAGVTDDSSRERSGEVIPNNLSQAKATKGKAGTAGITDPVRRSTAGTGLRVGEASADLPATSEHMDVTAGETAPNSDTIVAALLADHRARKTYPAGHTFSMTNPVINGSMVTLGTCSCGDSFSYPYGSAGHERMDAAIEAHRQKFDHLADKVDGRGNPIPDPSMQPYTEHTASTPPYTTAAAKKPRKKTEPAAGGLPAATCPPELEERRRIASAPSTDAPRGADAVNSAATPSDDLSAEALAQADWSPLMIAALDLAWREPQQVPDSLAALLDFGKVYVLGRKVERPILRWHGGKWKLAPWIISHFPPHLVYVEPFGGAGSVLMQKLPAKTEVWNDLEGEVVNLFRVLRSQTSDLARLIYLTPFSREEYHTLYEATDDPLERARRFVARSFMGQSSKGALRKSGFDSRINPDGFQSRLSCLRALPSEFSVVLERLRNVIIEQRPADQIFSQYDRPDVLFYVDPPYLADRADHYTHELDDKGHKALLETLRSLAGMVILSGYRSELYDSALVDWRRVETDANADTGAARTEVIWLNPACVAALDSQMPALFDIAALDSVNTPPLDEMTEAEV